MKRKTMTKSLISASLMGLLLIPGLGMVASASAEDGGMAVRAVDTKTAGIVATAGMDGLKDNSGGQPGADFCEAGSIDAELIAMSAQNYPHFKAAYDLPQWGDAWLPYFQQMGQTADERFIGLEYENIEDNLSLIGPVTAESDLKNVLVYHAGTDYFTGELSWTGYRCVSQQGGAQ